MDNSAGGSVFWIELPPGEGAAAPRLRAASSVALSGRRVLLVDDIAMNRDVIGAFLRAAGQEVQLADTGQEAVRLAFEQNFDLILMDVRMPEMDGLEATRQIRSLPPPRGRVPILALTAYALTDQAAQCVDAGMDGFIAKPVEYGTMMRAIEDAIARAPPHWAPDNGAPPAAEPAQDPPVRFDRAVFDETLAFLPRGDIDGTLQALRDRKEDMAQLLSMQAAPAMLTEAAHALASTAGMFGFMALSAVARRYENAVAQDAPEAEALAVQVGTEARATIAVLDKLRRERRLIAA